MENTLTLTENWRFQPDPYNEGERVGFARADYDVAKWREVTLPVPFDACGPGMASYEGAGWFRCTFTVPADWKGQYAAVEGEGVNYRARVWLNDVEIGENENGFLPFTFPVHPLLQFGKANTLVMRADNTRREGEVPGLQRGWRPYGGPLREIRLATRALVHLTDVLVTAMPEGERGHFSVTARVGNFWTEAVTGRIMVEIRDREGNVLGTAESATTEVTAGAEGDLQADGVCPQITAWSPENPTLYTAHSTLLTNDYPADERAITFGFRKIEIVNGKLRLNGQPLFLTGFNRHEDSPRTGPCPDPDTVRQDLRKMKELGANFVRLCHYPHHPNTLALCDEIGLLVMDEIPLYWWGAPPEGEEADARKLLAAQRQLSCLIKRDRNHPSVIFWSVSNETQEQLPQIAAGNAILVRQAREMDPTRFAVHVSDKWHKTPHFDADDVLCVNGYPTWFQRGMKENPDYQTADSSVFWRENLGKLHTLYPDKPILISEFGYPAIEGVLEGITGEELQAAAIAEEWKGFAADYICGATVWCFADHPWPEEDFIRRLTRSPFGVFTRDRQPKLAAEAVQKVFTEAQRRPSLRMHLASLDNLPPLEMPDGYVLREYREGDLVGLATLMHRAFPDMAWTPEDTQRALPGDKTVHHVFVITHGRNLVATASAKRDNDTVPGYVHWVGSDPDHRGKRLGYLATLATLYAFREMGCTDAILDTDDFRLPAIRVYFQLGFRPYFTHRSHAERWAVLESKLPAF